MLNSFSSKKKYLILIIECFPSEIVKFVLPVKTADQIALERKQQKLEKEKAKNPEAVKEENGKFLYIIIIIL